jgi:hypothetical protein
LEHVLDDTKAEIYEVELPPEVKSSLVKSSFGWRQVRCDNLLLLHEVAKSELGDPPLTAAAIEEGHRLRTHLEAAVHKLELVIQNRHFAVEQPEVWHDGSQDSRRNDEVTPERHRVHPVQKHADAVGVKHELQ